MELVDKIKSFLTTVGLLNTIIEGFLVMLIGGAMRLFWIIPNQIWSLYNLAIHPDLHLHRRDDYCSEWDSEPAGQRDNWYEQWGKHALSWSPGNGYRFLRGRSGCRSAGTAQHLRKPDGRTRWRRWVLNYPSFLP